MAAALAMALGLSGCGANSWFSSPAEVDADQAEVCATRTNPPKRVDDKLCGSNSGGSSYGFYRWQLGPGQNVHIPGIGKTIDTRTGGFDLPRPASNRITRVQPKGQTITRGGLGVNTVSSKGGSKGGSGGAKGGGGSGGS